jgi:hypothetical protein
VPFVFLKIDLASSTGPADSESQLTHKKPSRDNLEPPPSHGLSLECVQRCKVENFLQEYAVAIEIYSFYRIFDYL